MESGGSIVTTETLTLLTDVSPAFWYPRVYPWMAGIIKDHPGYDEQSVYAYLQANMMKLHVLKNDHLCGGLITMLQQYPLCMELFVVFAGGSGVKQWDVVEDQLTEYAKKLNCDVISFWGRKGWKRPFKKIVSDYQVYVKKVI